MPKPLPIDAALIEHLGELARIAVPDDRREQLRDKLQHLVQAFSALTESDFPEGKPASDGGEDAAAIVVMTPAQLRSDQQETPPSAAEILANAPQTAADCFVVARVVEP